MKTEKLWLKLSEVFKVYKTTYNEIIIEITLGKIKPTIVGGVVYLNNEELKNVFKKK